MPYLRTCGLTMRWFGHLRLGFHGPAHSPWRLYRREDEYLKLYEKIDKRYDDGASLYLNKTEFFQVTQRFWRGISNSWTSILVWLRSCLFADCTCPCFLYEIVNLLFFPPFALLATKWRGILYTSLLSTNRQVPGALPSWQKWKIKANESRKYQGVFEVKSRVKTWQVRVDIRRLPLFGPEKKN